MSNEEKQTDYTVGYGKPPKRTQFKPGQSGNPNGRPRKSTRLADDLETVLNSKVILTENGKPRKITKRRAIATQHVHKAMNGSIRATKLVVQCLQDARPDPHNSLSELVEEFRKRDHRLQNDRAKEDDDQLVQPKANPKGEKS